MLFRKKGDCVVRPASNGSGHTGVSGAAITVLGMRRPQHRHATHLSDTAITMTILIVMACVATMATIPTASALFLSNHTEYSYTNNTLDIHFTNRVNIFALDMTQVSIFDDDSACAFSLSWDSYDMANRDRTIITLTLTDAQRITLTAMSDPHVDLGAGSFAPALSEIPMYPHERRIHVSDTSPFNNTNCAITYGYDILSLSLHSSLTHRNATIQAIHDGFTAWSDLNPQLNFSYTNNTDPHITVEFVDYDPHIIGYACLDCIENPTLQVVLHSYNCRGSTIYYTPDTIRNTVAHELGHLLGLRHHTDGTHLMFGADRQLHPYRTDGYIIPELLPEGFHGEAALIRTLETLPDILDELDAELTDLESRGDREGDIIYFESQSTVNRYNNLLEEYRDTYNAYNSAYNRLECMYDPRNPNDPFFNPFEGLQLAPFEP